ncbi:MAG: ankyrin repeat domain-containing protein [Candidatus Schekmanbacteria bacterium]|nr:ankyrin repeat domain-containing protein [Candidatus Schekmanbacteria bacterium]
MSELRNGRELLSAAWDGRTDVVKSLLASGADVNSKDEKGKTAYVTPLMFAVLRGNFKTIETLLAHGADVNAKDRNGYTAIMMAQEINQIKIVEMLKNAGAKA